MLPPRSYTPSQLRRELERRTKEISNPLRWQILSLLISNEFPKRPFCWDVQANGWIMRPPWEGTCFASKRHANAVAWVLQQESWKRSGRRQMPKRKTIFLVQVRPWGKTWKPVPNPVLHQVTRPN